MKSVTARLKHMASGPVRPIRRWSVMRFLLLAMFWAVVTFVVGLWWWYSDRNPYFRSFEAFKEWLCSHLISPQSLLRPLALLVGVLMGGFHYLVLRFVPFETSKVNFQPSEKRLTKIAIILLAVIPACQVGWWFRAKHLYEICSARGLYSELQELEERRDYATMVRRMEETCIAFQSARDELGDWYTPRQPTGGGRSFMFITLLAMHAEPFQLNAPYSLSCYLGAYESYEIGGSLHPPPESCRPLASAMAESKVPIIRLSGLWWLDRRSSFEEEVDALVDGGDASFLSWKEMKTY